MLFFYIYPTVFFLSLFGALNYVSFMQIAAHTQRALPCGYYYRSFTSNVKFPVAHRSPNLDAPNGYFWYRATLRKSTHPESTNSYHNIANSSRLFLCYFVSIFFLSTKLVTLAKHFRESLDCENHETNLCNFYLCMCRCGLLTVEGFILTFHCRFVFFRTTGFQLDRYEEIIFQMPF